MEAGEGLSMGQEFADDIFVTGRERRQFLSFTCLSGDSAKGSPRHAGSRHNGAIKERVVLPHCPGEEEGQGSQAVCRLSATQHGDSSRRVSHAVH